MKPRILTTVAILCFLGTTGNGLTWDWPVSEIEVVVGFGALQDGLPLSGVYLVGADPTVVAVEDGRVIYEDGTNRCQWCLPSVLGAVVALEHDDGFRTLSGHLDSVVSRDGDPLRQGTRLGSIGQTGAAIGRRLFFQVYDTMRDVYVNPFLLLPIRSDVTPPRIVEIELVPEPDAEQTNQYQVLVTVVDRELGGRVPPYATELLIDGQLRNVVTFDVLRADRISGRLETDAGLPVDEVFSSNGILFFGTQTIIPGVTQVEIVARDFYDNTTQETMVLSAP